MANKLNNLEKSYLHQIMKTNNNRHSSSQLVKLGIPYSLLTKLLKADIIHTEEDCNGIKYYGVSESILD